uniref:G-protein coupled receptors family 1 profile domain-containing protein n=1 Tax=Capra hircus TaxID=9925 RepID=A0A452ELV5_CAPHI
MGHPGFPAVQPLGKALFPVHLLTYLASVTGNTLVITITWADHHLQTPMYFFPSSFSFLECCFTTTVIPKLLAIFPLGRQKISFAACITRAFVFLFLGAAVFFLMAVLSLDRYMAICKPLYYATTMNPRICSLLATACLVFGFSLMVVPVTKLSQLSVCGSHVIPHFFCDLGPLINLPCSDIRSIEMLAFGLAFNMVAAILRLPSAKERQEAFSTCSSHRSVLSLMYGSCVFIYLKPKQVSRLDSNKEAALVNAVVTPLLNPVIYTLRNKQVHQALRDTLSRVRLQK